MKEDLTKPEKKVLGAIVDLFNKNGYSPSYEEIRKKTGYASASTVHYHIRALIKKGCLTRTPFLSRALSVEKDVDKE